MDINSHFHLNLLAWRFNGITLLIYIRRKRFSPKKISQMRAACRRIKSLRNLHAKLDNQKLLFVKSFYMGNDELHDGFGKFVDRKWIASTNRF